MTLPARSLRSPVGIDFAAFVGRARPRVDRGLADAVEAVPAALGTVRPVVGRTLGVRGRAGRRWRPMLTLAVAEALGADLEVALDAATAVELTHTASLILDDLPCMDDSGERRGEPAAHVLLGQSGAILLSIGLLARAAELLGRSRDGAELSEEWGRTFGFGGMAGGQAVDVALGGDSRGAMRRLYRKKTTALVAFAADAGARVAGAHQEDCERLYAFGDDLGWAYQLVDDAHDLEEDAALGRAPGGRAPLRQGRRLLQRGLGRLDEVLGIDERGVELLSTLSREVVRVPGEFPLRPRRRGVQPC